uniref:IclR family transcriptional regulator domain-containing protein n=1 Tax=Mycolicibacterium hippocampi TaxID=659824 RepID=UPI0035566502
MGKALLAFASGELPQGPLRSMTGETIVDAAVLATQLDTVRATGIADEIEEAVIGECASAAAVFDSSGEAVGAIGLVVPAARWPMAPADIDALRDAARTVSRELGAPVWPARR